MAICLHIHPVFLDNNMKYRLATAHALLSNISKAFSFFLSASWDHLVCLSATSELLPKFLGFYLINFFKS